MSCVLRIICINCLLAYSLYANAQVAPSIAEFKVTLAPSQSLPLGQQISLNITTSKIEALNDTLANYYHVETSVINKTTLNVKMSARPQYKNDISNASKKYLADTFVIDFSEQSTKSVAALFSKATSVYSTLESSSVHLSKFEAFVAQFIDKPTYAEGFNIASVVASQRSGDCTEHAVLLTALLRAHDIPARVMLGTVLIDDGLSLRAVGHAWVEAWQEHQWQILDSALHPLIGARKYYLPAHVLDNEGLGFGMSVAKSVGLIPQKIDMVKSIN